MNKPTDKTVEEMTPAEIRAGIAEFGRSTRPASDPLPLPPGISPGDKDSTKAGAGEAYANFILEKPAGQLNEFERAFLKAHAAAALKEWGGR